MAQRTVIIVGMAGGWPNTLEPGQEVWGCNNAWTLDKHVARLYYFDDLDRWQPGDLTGPWIQAVNSLKIPVITRASDPRIRLSEPYPLTRIVRALGRCYFNCTVSYMIADAIYEKADRIILHQLFCGCALSEYHSQKACMDYWIGYADGKGIKVELTGHTWLARPCPWDSPLYGWIREDDRKIPEQLARVIKRNMKRFPEFTLIGPTHTIRQLLDILPPVEPSQKVKPPAKPKATRKAARKRGKIVKLPAKEKK